MSPIGYPGGGFRSSGLLTTTSRSASSRMVSGVDLANVKMSMNPFDEIAVEEAIRLKEAGKARKSSPFPSARSRRRKPCAPRSPWALTAASWSRPTTHGRAAGRRQDPQGCRRARKSPTSSSSASRRSTTMQPDRPDAVRPAWLEPGTFASKVEIGDGDGRRHPRGRRRPADHLGQDAGHRHHRPAPQRAALRVAAQHHEGQEEAARREERRPTTASTSRRASRCSRPTEPPGRKAASRSAPSPNWSTS
jgi:electron transfer flavoprotein alpha subunit